MKKELDKFEFTADDITDENIDLSEIEEPEEIDLDDAEEILESESRSRSSEDLDSIKTDDNVKIYLHQIGKIPLLTAEDEFELSKKNSRKKR